MLVFCMVAAAGCQKTEQPQAKKTPQEKNTRQKTEETEEMEERVAEGLVMTYGEDGVIFVDTARESLFHAYIPEEEIYDENGGKITIEEMEDGDRFAFYGNGMVLETYPPKYAGITKAVRQKQGTKEDIEPYKELLNEIYQEPDPSEIPYMDIEYRRKDAVVTMAIEPLGYTWTAPAENGKKETIQACGAHILDMKGAEPVRTDEATDTIRLIFSRSPKEVKVTRWKNGTKAATAGEGEAVELTLEKREADISDMKKGCSYQVETFWEQGTVTYGFVTE